MPIYHTETRSFSSTQTRTKSISSDAGIKSTFISHTEIKSIRTAYTKCESVCMLTKTSDLRRAIKNLVSFHHLHNNEIEIIFYTEVK